MTISSQSQSYPVLRGKEATDPTALPAGVGHEHPRGGAHPPPAPLWTARMFIMTARVHPTTGGSTGPLHEVKHLPAGDSLVRIPRIIRIIILLTDQEVSVQLTGSSLILPLPTQVGLVLHLPSFS